MEGWAGGQGWATPMILVSISLVVCHTNQGVIHRSAVNRHALKRSRQPFLVFEAKHSVCSKQNIPCVRSRTFLMVQAGHLLCSKQEISCVSRRTSPVFQERHLLWS